MRQLLIQVPRGGGAEVQERAAEHDALNVAQLEGTSGPEPCDLVVVHVSNRQVGPLVDALGHIADLRVSFFPQGAVTLRPPPSEAPDQVEDVEPRSPLEVFLGGFQSIGSWSGFLGYAAVAGVVVWVALFTNTTYLLTAAMLIAPFAGPAMNTAMGTATGEWRLIGPSLLRYAVGLSVTIAVAALLSLIAGQQIASLLMLDQSKVSAAAFLLPIAAGAAGALNLVQSDRDSLVSGAAVGVLVAASLAPPTGIVGMAAVIGRWDLVQDAGFVLVLQLVGINLSGALIFRLFGLSTQRRRYDAGSPGVSIVAGAVTAAALAGLLYFQFSRPIALERSTLEQRAAHAINQAVEDVPEVALVEASPRFTRAQISDQKTLLADVYVQRKAGTAASAEVLRAQLTALLQQRLTERWPEITPLVRVSVLDPP